MTAPEFVPNDPKALLREMVSAFETATGKTLYPGQVERLLIDLILYREVLLRQAIQATAEQNLIDYATGARLEALGRLLGVTNRIPASKATVQWKIKIPAPQSTDLVFPAGYSAIAPNGLLWALTATVTLSAGQTEITAIATCQIPGAAGNNVKTGAAFSPMTGTATITAVQDAGGGSDAENDEQLRARILEAPFKFSSAGPGRAYRFHAMGVSPSIIDVAVKTLSPGEVGIYPLTKDGLPVQALLDAVKAALNAESIRPICDLVTVAPPVKRDYAIQAKLTVFEWADRSDVLTRAQAAAAAYVADRKAQLGRDLVGSQVIKALSVEGVYKVELVSWTDRVLDKEEWAVGTYAISLEPGAANG